MTQALVPTNLKPGDHVCCLYETDQERDAALIDFVRQGLEHNHRVLCIIDSHTTEQMLACLRQVGLDADFYLERGQLSVVKSDEVYLPAEAIDLLPSQMDQSLAQGYVALRVVSEMNRSFVDPADSERLVEYQLLLNEFLANNGCLALCLYDRRHFKPEFLLDVLRTQPLIMIDDEAYHNSYYIQGYAPDDSAAELRDWMQNLVQRRQSEKTLRESETRYRLLFEQAQSALIETQALYHISRSLIDFENLADLLQTVVDSVAGALPADRVTLITFESDKVIHFVKGGPGAAQVVQISFQELWEGLSGWVIRQGEPALSSKHVPDSRESLPVQQRRVETNCGAIIVVPLSYRGAIFGTMTAINRPDERNFTQRDLELIQAMASQAAIAIENARLCQDAQQEIAERRQIEAALRESEAKYRNLVEQIPAITYIAALDEHSTTLYVSPQVAVLLGYSQADYQSDPDIWRKKLHVKDQARVMQALAHSHAQNEAFVSEYRMWTKDGRLVWFCDKAAIVLDDAGQPMFLQGVMFDITEHKLAEEALQESEHRFRTITEDALAGVYIVQDEQFRYVNPAFAQIFGCQPEQVVQKKDFLDLIYPDDRAMVADQVQRRLSGQVESVHYTFRGLHQRGHAIYCEVLGKRIEYQGQAAIIGTLIDVTERKQVEDKLAQRAAQLALLNDIGGQIAATLDLDTVLARAARLVQQRFGYHHVGLFTMDDQQKALVMRAKSGDFAELFPLEHQLKLGQGLVGWAGMHGKTLLANDVDAEPHYVNLYPDILSTRSELSVPVQVGEEILGVLDVQSPKRDAFDENDVMVIETLADQIAVALENARLYEAVQWELTERVRAEEALRQSEERYRVVSELMSDFAYAVRVEPDGSLSSEWVTEAFTHITGFSPAELDTRGGWRDLVHPDDWQIALETFERHLAGQADTCEVRIVTKQGQMRWLRNYGRPVWNETQDRIVRLCGAAQDITEQKQMEQYMLRSERLAAMGHMAAALAHEVKNPLQAIRSNLELVLDFVLEPGEREEHLYLCRQEIERLAEITHRVLSFARPTKDIPHPTLIRRLVHQALALVRQPLQQSGVQVSTDIPTDLPPVLIAPPQIIQVLLNLIINTIEAMPDGGHLQIMAQAEDDMLLLVLVNDGPVIEPGHLEHIFDPFFTTKPEGTGLGLSISHSIIQGYGGAICVENLQDKQGVRFSITLPIAPDQAE